MLQIAENASRIKPIENLGVQRSLALVQQMVNGKTRNNGIKLAERWHGSIQIVLNYLYARVPCEALAHRFQHGWRKVQGNSFRVLILPQSTPDQRQQPAISGAEIENPPGMCGDELQQRGFPLLPMRDGIGALQVLLGVLAGSPEIDGLRSAHEVEYREQVHSEFVNLTGLSLNGVARLLLAVVLSLGLWIECPAQAQPAPQTGQNPPATTPQAQDQGAAQTKDQSKGEDKGEVKITPREAEELFHSVDEILEFDSKQTGLRIRKQVKRKLTSREEVVSYLTKHMNDEDTKRLRRSELVLKKFGLLPNSFNLETFLVALLKEEVAGYYDPKTKTVNLLDWVPMQEQEPVMAHELTHALQDQSVGLEKWMKHGDKDLGEIKKDPTPMDIENDETDDAREAVVEGQAQAMMFQFALSPTGHSIVDSPALLDAMEEETLTGTPETKVFNEAPIFLKESMTFPYSYGMEFVVKIMQKSGKDKAFEGVLKNPPHTTRQIMQPETYLAGERIEPMRVPDFKRDFSQYQKFDIGAMGEFDVDILIEQYAGRKRAKQMYPAWRGGYYYAAKQKSNPSAPLGLLYVSRWSSPEKAAEFASIYAHSLNQRYKSITPVAEGAPEKAEQRMPNSAGPLHPASFAQTGDTDEQSKPALLTGRHAWTTNEGAVIIEQRGDTVFVSESLDPATTATLEQDVFGR